jgi:hypothetical protein
MANVRATVEEHSEAVVAIENGTIGANFQRTRPARRK